MTSLVYVLSDTSDKKTEAQCDAIEQAHNVESWFVDEAATESTKAIHRPEFSALCKCARKGDTVIVSSIECLGRCSIELFESLQALEAKGVNVVSVRENFDLSSPVGKALLKTIAAISDLKRTVIGDEKRNGKWLSSPATGS